MSRSLARRTPEPGPAGRPRRRALGHVPTRIVVPLVLALAAAAAGGSATTSAGPPAAIPPAAARMEGGPDAVGRAHGHAFQGEIRDLFSGYLKPLLSALGTDVPEMASRARAMEPFIPERYRAEMRALAEATGLDYEQVLVANTFLDLKEIPRCSTIAAASPATRDGEVILGRNLDFPSLGIAHKHTRLLAVHPEGHRSFVAVGWPGLAGVLSGMNRDGLALAVMEVYDGESTEAGTPYLFLFRQILEECGTTAEAISLLRRARITTSNNLILADRSGDVAVAEIGPREVFVRRSKEGAVYSCNHFQRDSDFVLPFFRRYLALRRFAREHQGSIDVASIEKALVEVEQPLLTIQSMIFLPRTLELRLAWNEVPATRAPWTHIPLEPLLR
jgi:hypothetical protein